MKQQKMLFNIIWILIQIALISTAAYFSAYALHYFLNDLETRTMKKDCYEWQMLERNYPMFEASGKMIGMCSEIGIEIE